MKVQVLGKEFKTGNAKKTGKPYQATIIYLAYVSPKVDGIKTDHIFVSIETIPYENIVVDATYELVMGLSGYLESFTLIPKKEPAAM